jgi:hypothetical protein
MLQGISCKVSIYIYTLDYHHTLSTNRGKWLLKKLSISIDSTLKLNYVRKSILILVIHCPYFQLAVHPLTDWDGSL